MTTALNYPGAPPGAATCTLSDKAAVLSNAAIRCEWTLDAGRIAGLTVENRHTGQTVSFTDGFLPRLVLGDEQVMDLGTLSPVESVRADGNGLVAVFPGSSSGLRVAWSARLSDGANAVIQRITLTADSEARVNDVIFLDARLPGARQVGEVDGSVVVCDRLFMAVEYPLAKNEVDADGGVRCALHPRCILKAGESRTYSSVIGAVPAGQLRRGFLYYLEGRRVRPYRQFLHYNNWYDVVLSRPVERMTEPECLETIEYYGRELVERRGVELDAFVWDDGWDDFNTLWDFHKGFPDGFRNLMAAAGKYGAEQGVWMSPNGGYARAKEARIAYGEPLGYETNANGFAMGGRKYRDAYRGACLRMMRENGVVFFKFDGMGEGGTGQHAISGSSGELSDDIHAILELSRELHDENPHVYVSATCGTWSSPFWLLFADSVWRQGGDSGHHGAGDTRQQWMTYRDMFCYERVVQAGPLYPLNSLMLHGILIGDRPNRAPAGMVLDEKSVADEVWSFFGSGTCLQELYVSPGVPTESMLDQLAAAARWARGNADMLIDTHWVGGNPGEGEVYGWASWQPGKGILVLRNPSTEEAAFSARLDDVFELPEAAQGAFVMTSVYPSDRLPPDGRCDSAEQVSLKLAPFETIVVEFDQHTEQI